MAHRLLWCALTLWLVAMRPLLSQEQPTGYASLSAIVIDSLSGKPVLRLVLWNVRRTGPRNRSAYYVKAESTGVLRLDSVPAGVPQHFQVVCEQGRMQAKQLDSLTIILAPGEVRQWAVQSSAQGCDQRPFIARRAVFEGLWRFGFEESRFLPCDSLIPEAWVEFAPDAQEVPGLRWPRDLDKYYPEVFIRFEGLLVGPWRYGHLGVSDYQLTVYRTLAVRKPSKARCGR